MLSPEQIETLEAFDSGGAPVLSAYLDLDPARRVRRTYRAAFHDLVQAARERVDEAKRRAFTEEVARVTTLLEVLEPAGKALALFACAPRQLWQTVVLSVRVDDHLVFEPKPDVAPLLAILDDYERYAVALVDKSRARLFIVFAGEIEESDAFVDAVPGKTDEGGPAQSHYQRHHDLHVLWHLKRVVKRLAEMLRRRRFDRLVIAGPEEATSALRRLLPRALAQRVVGVVPAELTMGEQEILERTLEIERRIEHDAEQRLLDELLGTARAGGRATYGVAATLDALALGDVQTLVVADGVHAEGSECPNCGLLESGGLATCRLVRHGDARHARAPSPGGGTGPGARGPAGGRARRRRAPAAGGGRRPGRLAALPPARGAAAPGVSRPRGSAGRNAAHLPGRWTTGHQFRTIGHGEASILLVEERAKLVTSGAAGDNAISPLKGPRRRERARGAE